MAETAECCRAKFLISASFYLDGQRSGVMCMSQDAAGCCRWVELESTMPAALYTYLSQDSSLKPHAVFTAASDDIWRGWGVTPWTGVRFVVFVL
jgi:hypothetical protein